MKFFSPFVHFSISAIVSLKIPDGQVLNFLNFSSYASFSSHFSSNSTFVFPEYALGGKIQPDVITFWVPVNKWPGVCSTQWRYIGSVHSFCNLPHLIIQLLVIYFKIHKSVFTPPRDLPTRIIEAIDHSSNSTIAFTKKVYL